MRHGNPAEPLSRSTLQPCLSRSGCASRSFSDGEYGADRDSGNKNSGIAIVIFGPAGIIYLGSGAHPTVWGCVVLSALLSSRRFVFLHHGNGTARAVLWPITPRGIGCGRHSAWMRGSCYATITMPSGPCRRTTPIIRNAGAPSTKDLTQSLAGARRAGKTLHGYIGASGPACPAG